MESYFKHSTAFVESQQIGANTRIWAFAHVMAGAVIGQDCNIGDHCFIESGVVIGDGVTIKNQTAIWEGVTIEAYAFIGPNVVFTNDLRPRSPRLPLVAQRYQEKRQWLRPTLIQRGASLGANTTLLCGLTIGEYAMIGAGSLVTRDIPAYTLAYGHPARCQGYVCRCGANIEFQQAEMACVVCGLRYLKHIEGIKCLSESIED